jgi:hypothetical protein
VCGVVDKMLTKVTSGFTRSAIGRVSLKQHVEADFGWC